MLSSVLPKGKFSKFILVSLAAIFAAFISAPETRAVTIAVEKSGNLGVIKGIVRDEANSPISEATVAIFRAGTSKLLKQVRSATDGSFLTKVMPGTYTVLAVAQGFNPVTLAEVEVNRSAELVYRFKLERSGNGNTLPEKQADRNSSKWRIRAAQNQRSIYQSTEGDSPINEAKTEENVLAQTEAVEKDLEVVGKENEAARRGQTVVETYFARSGKGNFAGLNFATVQPVGKNAEIVFAGQTGKAQSAPQRFETNLKFRPSRNHQIRLNGSIASFGDFKLDNQDKSFGQISLQATDEWKVSEGVILVFGFDYSRFVGAGKDFSISPRVGLQFDADSKTRFRTAYTTQTEERTWQNVVELEETQVLFREPAAIQEFVVENNKPRMNKNRRLEFGVERVLDNKSSVEANVFFDAVTGRGVGLNNFSFDTLSGEGFGDFVAEQQGKAQGVRVVYTRRLNGIFSTSAGYAFGNGQKLSENAISNPADTFEKGFFQTFYGQIDADFGTGTQVKTVFRLSPQATVFAVDPFQGRLAIYDPSLSVKVTQSLPTWGLPVRAKAMVDARNLFDYQTGINTKEGSLQFNSQKRILRGGIMVRF